MDAKIEKVVDETEEGYVLSDRGAFRLPDKSTKIEIAYEEYYTLVEGLKGMIGKRARLHINDSILVGLESEKPEYKVLPPYKLRRKIIYSEPPEQIVTTMLGWDADTYRLSIFTQDGTYCIQNDYAVMDYYERVRNKLERCCKKQDKVNINVTIKFHGWQSSYECAGEVEDIEL